MPATEGFDCACWFSCIYIILPADVAVDIRDGNCRLDESTLCTGTVLCFAYWLSGTVHNLFFSGMKRLVCSRPRTMGRDCLQKGEGKQGGMLKMALRSSAETKGLVLVLRRPGAA